MQDEGRNQAVIVIVLAASLGVASSVVTLGMGFVNVMSADAGGRLSAFGLANGRPARNSPAAQAPDLTARFVDINYLREEITSRQDQVAALRQEMELASKQLDIQRKLRERLESAQNPDSQEADGVPMEAQSMAREISRIESEIARLRQRQEELARVDLTHWPIVDKSLAKPQWLECRNDGVVLLPQATHFTGPDLQTADGPFAAALNSQFAVLLVRPSGFDACAAARKILEAHRIEYDMAPVDESWQLIFR